jgi:hypothetical protein
LFKNTFLFFKLSLKFVTLSWPKQIAKSKNPDFYNMGHENHTGTTRVR